MYSQQVTLPTTPCANCTLQLMQIMQVTAPYNSFYWQCADIVIAGEGGGDVTDPGDVDGGCSAGASPGAGALLLIALMALRRSRSASASA
jgi:Synergist-CTERM protein sorting domain-containing protein